MTHYPGTARRGRLYLVGAGPGDPGLLTLRGSACLAEADVVLYDYLVNPGILAHARQGAELVCLGRHGRDRIWSQAEIQQRMIREALAGKTVVRLKAGDPAIFAHFGEEMEALTGAGIPTEVVPGVTAALAAGSYAGVPLTHRDWASAVAFVTGHEDAEKAGSALDYAALAQFPGTLVIYMGVTTAPQWTRALLEAGKSPDTPAAIIRRVSLPDQSTALCRLDEVADRIVQCKIRPPAIVVVGQTVALAEVETWFTRRPLFGKRIMVTRPATARDELCERLESLGAEVWVQPAIEIADPADWSPCDAAIARLESFDWLVFSSANGVRYLLDRLLSGAGDLRQLGRVRLAAIGPGTSEELLRYKLKADLVPPSYRAESLAAELAREAAGKRFLLARASRGREVLAEQLAAAGGRVEQVVVYTSRDLAQPDAEVIEALRSGRLDWITVTSSAIARSLVKLYGELLRRTRLASISPLTSDTLRELGFEPAAEARSYCVAGLVEAIQAASAEK